MAFGPHGPRAPTSAPGDGLKVFLATAALVGLGGVLFYVSHLFGIYFHLTPPPNFRALLTRC